VRVPLLGKSPLHEPVAIHEDALAALHVKEIGAPTSTVLVAVRVADVSSGSWW